MLPDPLIQPAFNHLLLPTLSTLRALPISLFSALEKVGIPHDVCESGGDAATPEGMLDNIVRSACDQTLPDTLSNLRTLFPTGAPLDTTTSSAFAVGPDCETLPSPSPVDAHLRILPGRPSELAVAALALEMPSLECAISHQRRSLLY